MRVVCYYRHSTDNSQQDANSIPRQRFACQKFASRLGWAVVEEIEDKGESGAGDKTNLMQLSRDVESGFKTFDVLLVDSQSRVTRKNAFRIFEDIQWLDLNGIKISCVDENDTEPTTVESWATNPAKVIKIWQNNQVVLEAAEKATDGLYVSHQEKRLSWVGIAPFAFDRVIVDRPAHAKDTGKPYKTLVPNKDRAIVKDIFEKFLEGRSVRSLVAELGTADKYKDKFPNASVVKHILRNPIYAGVWAFGVRNVGKHKVLNPTKGRNNWNVNVIKNAASMWEGYVEPIVSMDLFLKVQDKLDDNAQTHSGRPAKCNYRYTGLFRCANCGGSLTPQKRQSTRTVDGKKVTVDQVDYRCVGSITSGKKCRDGVKPWAKMIPEQDIDDQISSFFGEHVSLNTSFHFNLIEFLAQEMKETSFSAKAGLSDRLAELKVKEMQIEKDYEKIGEMPDWLADKLKKVLEEKRSIREQLDKSSPFSSYVKSKVDAFKEGLEDEAGRYMTVLYDVLMRYAEDGFDWSQEKKEKESAELSQRYLYQIPDGQDVNLLVDESDIKDRDDDGVIAGFTFASPDTVLQLMRAMGFTVGGVKFRKTTEEEGRGLRWVPESIEFAFIWSDENSKMPHTLKDLPLQ